MPGKDARARDRRRERSGGGGSCARPAGGGCWSAGGGGGEGGGGGPGAPPPPALGPAPPRLTRPDAPESAGAAAARPSRRTPPRGSVATPSLPPRSRPLLPGPRPSGESRATAGGRSSLGQLPVLPHLHTPVHQQSTRRHPAPWIMPSPRKNKPTRGKPCPRPGTHYPHQCPSWIATSPRAGSYAHSATRPHAPPQPRMPHLLPQCAPRLLRVRAPSPPGRAHHAVRGAQTPGALPSPTCPSPHTSPGARPCPRWGGESWDPHVARVGVRKRASPPPGHVRDPSPLPRPDSRR